MAGQPGPGTSRVAIKAIFNANVAYTRRSPGDLSELTASISKKGMLIPVLLDPDYLVIDGARRVHSADELRWDYVPAVVTSDWRVVQQHLLLTRAAEVKLPSLPMTWIELAELYRTTLTRLYEPIRRAESGQKAAQNRGKGKKPAPWSYPKFMVEAAAMLGMTEPELYGMNTIGGHLDKLRAISEEAYAEGVAKVARVEETSHAPWEAARTLLRFRKGVNEPHVAADTKLAAKQLTVMQNALPVLSIISTELASLAPLNGALSPEDALAVLTELRKFTSRLYVIKKELMARANLTEREIEA